MISEMSCEIRLNRIYVYILPSSSACVLPLLCCCQANIETNMRKSLLLFVASGLKLKAILGDRERETGADAGAETVLQLLQM